MLFNDQPRPQGVTYSDAEEKLCTVLTNFGPAELPEILRRIQMHHRDLSRVLRLAIAAGTVACEGTRYCVTNARKGNEASRIAGMIFNPHESLRGCLSAVEDWSVQLRKLAQGRPREHDEWQQSHVTLRTSLLRALYLPYRGDAQGKDVVLLGDADLTSLAMCLVGNFGRIIILEGDPEVVSFLRSAIDQLATENVEVLSWDARNPLPDNLRESADTVMCDPSRRLYRLFFGCGAELLRASGVFYTFVNPSHGDPAGQFILQRDAISQGWILTDSIPVFNEYQRYATFPTECTDRNLQLEEASDEDILFTETLVRLIRGPSTDAENFIRRTIHER
jgi:hypothetical protein